MTSEASGPWYKQSPWRLVRWNGPTSSSDVGRDFFDLFSSGNAKNKKNKKNNKHSLLPDDTIATFRSRLGDAMNVQGEELCFWVTKKVNETADATEDFLVRALKRRVAAPFQELLHLHSLHVGDLSPVPAVNESSAAMTSSHAKSSSSSSAPAVSTGVSTGVSTSKSSLTAVITWEQALTRDELKVTSTYVEHIGSRFAFAGAPLIVGGNPFRSAIEIDQNLVGPDGRPRRGSYEMTSEDTMTLETAMKGTVDGVLNFCTLKDYLSNIPSRGATSPPVSIEAVLHGHVHKFFPLAHPGAAISPGAKNKEYAKSVTDVVSRIRSETIESPSDTWLQSARIAVAAPPWSLLVSSGDTEAKADLLFQLFAAFRVTYEVPVLRHFDGTRLTFKLHRQSASTAERDGGIPQNLLSRWTSLGVRQGEPYLQAFLRLESAPGAPPAMAAVRMRGDLSMMVSRSFSRFAGAQIVDLPETLSRASNAFVKPLQTLLNRVIDAPLRLRSPLQASSSMHFTVRVQLNSDPSMRTPSFSEMRASLMRLPSFFMTLGTASDGSLVMQYRRVDGFESLARIPIVVRLLRARAAANREDAIAELARTFSLSAAEAEARLATHSDINSGKAWQALVLLATRQDSNVPTIELRALGRIGFVATVHNASSREQVARISSLLSLAQRAASGSNDVQLEPPISDVVAAVDVVDVNKSTTARIKADKSPMSAEESAEDDASSAIASSDDELEDLINEELRGQDSPAMQDTDASRGNRLASDAVDLAAPAGAAAGDNAGAVFLPLSYLLTQLYRADPALFRFKNTRYATDCGHVDDRQPVVITPQEKEKIDRERPGSYNDAVAYGTTAELAQRNIYICPKVWCPKSRIPMTQKQYEDAGKRCPGEDEEAMVFDKGYFSGRERYVGFLDARKHPNRMCMPCCFLRPAKRVDSCGAKIVTDATGKTTKKNKADVLVIQQKVEHGVEPAPTVIVESDAKYVRGDVAPLEEGRIGVLPPELATLMGDSACGNRDDGSGQLTSFTSCYVRFGIKQHMQTFIQCIVVALRNPSIATVEDFISAVELNLTGADFVSLNGGRLCRSYMATVSAESELSALERAEFASFKHFLSLDTEYVKNRLGLDTVSAYVQHARDGRSIVKAAANGNVVAMTAMREYIIFAAMRRFLDELADPDLVKTHLHLLDLASSSLPWLNPRRLNFVLVERVTPAGDTDAKSPRPPAFISCPAPQGADLRKRWRLADPFVILMRQGNVYEPVHHVRLKRRGIRDTREFSYDGDAGLHRFISSLMKGCSTDGSYTTPSSRIAAALSSLDAEPAAQVLDYAFRLVGLVTQGSMFVPLPEPETALAEPVRVAYVSDLPKLKPILSVSACRSLLDSLATSAGLPGLRVKREIASKAGGGKRKQGPAVCALELDSGAIVPIDMSAENCDVSPYLEHLNMFVGTSFEEEEVQKTVKPAQDKAAAVRGARQAFVRAVRGSRRLMQEVLALRSSFHPFPYHMKRDRMFTLVRRHIQMKLDDWTVNRVTDVMLHDSSALSLRDAVEVDDTNAVVLNDTDILSGALDRLTATRASVYDAHPHDSSTAYLKLSQEDELNHKLRALSREASSSTALGLAKTKSRTRLPLSRARTLFTGLRVRFPTKISDVDVYSVMSLADRLLHTALGRPVETLRAVVKNQLISDARLDIRRLKTSLQQHPDPRLRAAGTAARLGAVIDEDDYIGGTYDLRVMAEFCGIQVIVLPSDWLLPHKSRDWMTRRPRSADALGDVARPASNRPVSGIVRLGPLQMRLVKHSGARAHVLVLKRRPGMYESFDVVMNLDQNRLLFDANGLELLLLRSSRRASYAIKAAKKGIDGRSDSRVRRTHGSEQQPVVTPENQSEVNVKTRKPKIEKMTKNDKVKPVMKPGNKLQKVLSRGSRDLEKNKKSTKTK